MHKAQSTKTGLLSAGPGARLEYVKIPILIEAPGGILSFVSCLNTPA